MSNGLVDGQHDAHLLILSHRKVNRLLFTFQTLTHRNCLVYCYFWILTLFSYLRVAQFLSFILKFKKCIPRRYNRYNNMYSICMQKSIIGEKIRGIVIIDQRPIITQKVMLSTVFQHFLLLAIMILTTTNQSVLFFSFPQPTTLIYTAASQATLCRTRTCCNLSPTAEKMINFFSLDQKNILGPMVRKLTQPVFWTAGYCHLD